MKRAKILALRALRATGAFRLARRFTRQRLRILCYHGAWRGSPEFVGDSMFISAGTFERRMKLLRDLDYPVLALGAAVGLLRAGKPLPDAAVVITLDDGWYSAYTHMLPALRRYGFPATLYCDTENLLAGMPVPHVMVRYLRQIHCGDGPLPPAVEDAFDRATDLALPREQRLNAALEFGQAIGVDMKRVLGDRVFDYMTPVELAQARHDGLDIELHTHSHSLHDFSPENVASEIEQNRAALASILGCDPATFRHFCYPSGYTGPGVGPALAAAGVESATTLDSGMAGSSHDPMLLPRLTDGEHLSDIEFEAELCGLAAWIHALRNRSWVLRREPTLEAAT